MISPQRGIRSVSTVGRVDLASRRRPESDRSQLGRKDGGHKNISSALAAVVLIPFSAIAWQLSPRDATLAAVEPENVIFSVAKLSEANFTLDFTGLEDLGSGWAYEGWLIVDGAPVSTGVFTVNSGGAPSATGFSVARRDLSKATAFVLTIEPARDSDPAPSAVHVLAGDFQGDRAKLSGGHRAALGDSFWSATGSYILAAPSGNSRISSYANGIWWLDPAAGPGPVLNLPELPDGWEYEGWVVGPDGPISTGRFTTVGSADSDGAGSTGGPKPTPPFPGQDFVTPPLDLTNGYAAVISIEPAPDNSPRPFAFKPLVDMDISDVGKGVLQAMRNNSRSFPTGTATR